MERPKVKWNDLHEGTCHELKSTYKLTDKQLEQQIRKHWDGADKNARDNLYRTVYDKKK